MDKSVRRARWLRRMAALCCILAGVLLAVSAMARLTGQAKESLPAARVSVPAGGLCLDRGESLPAVRRPLQPVRLTGALSSWCRQLLEGAAGLARQGTEKLSGLLSTAGRRDPQAAYAVCPGLAGHTGYRHDRPPAALQEAVEKAPVRKNRTSFPEAFRTNRATQ